MNIFTVITTFLNLALCSYAAFKKDNPTFSQKLAYLKNPTIIIPAPMQVETLMDKDVDYDNYKFKNEILYVLILVLIAIIFVSFFGFGWSTLSIPEEAIPLLSLGTRLTECFYFALFNTAKYSILSIVLLACGIIYKNYKNPDSSYRFFHLICYSLLIVSVIANSILLFNTEYGHFMSDISRHVSGENLLENFVCSEGAVFIVLQTLMIIICIYKLAYACIFNEYKSLRLRVNFQHILERIFAPVIFSFFTLYIIILNQCF